MFKRTLKFDQDIDAAKLETHLADCLRRIDARAVNVYENGVSFTSGSFLRVVSHLNILGPIGFGDLTIDPVARQIRYRLSFRRLLVAWTVVIGFLAGSIWYQAHSWGLIKMLPFLWLAGVIISVTASMSRFEYFLLDAVKTAPRLNPMK